MKKLMASAFAFLESKPGLLLLGFLVTTAGGSFLNAEIQRISAEKEHNFEMYKTRLSEAKVLQQNLLETSTARFFYLHQVLAKLEHPEEFPRESVKHYWKVVRLFNVNRLTEEL